MTEIQERAAALQERIFNENYFTYVWCEVIHQRGMSATKIDKGEHEDKDLVLLCQDFWEALPDRSDIRHGPFFALCDLAEHDEAPDDEES